MGTSQISDRVGVSLLSSIRYWIEAGGEGRLPANFIALMRIVHGIADRGALLKAWLSHPPCRGIVREAYELQHTIAIILCRIRVG